MNWIKRFKWIFFIGLFFTLFVASNILDERNFKKMGDSIVSIYEDRLLMKNTILNMATVINQKEVAFLTKDSVFLKKNNQELNNRLKADLQNFDRTSFLTKQQSYLVRLETDLEQMFNEEKRLMQNQFADIDNYKEIIQRVNENVSFLAQIQVTEGKRELIKSQRSMTTIGIFSWLEIIVMTLLSIVAIMLVYREYQH